MCHMAAIGFIALLLCSCSSPREPRFRIGVSQCSEGAWRAKQNAEMERELLLHDGISMELICCHDISQQQIEDIRGFINQKVDLIVVSPNEEDVTPAIAEAYDAGIPVIVFDRQVVGDKYTAFVGGDNEGAGRQLVRYAMSRSLPASPSPSCRIIELTGTMSTTPAQMRHRGIVEELKSYPQAQLLASVDARWSGDEAAALMDSVLACHPDVDVVIAHSDWMASRAKMRANELQPGNHIRFAGIDGIVGPGEGVEAIELGRLDASATYPTGGDIIMQTAIRILEGKPYERETLLESHLIASREDAMLASSMQRAIDREAGNIRNLRSRLDYYWERHSLEQALAYTLGILLVLALGLMVTLYLYYRSSRRTSQSLARQRATLKEQRDQLLSLTRELEQANAAKMNFFTNVSHDFRTPLTLISAPIEKLGQNAALLDSESRQLLQLAQKNIGVLRRLVNQILDFRKTESVKMQLDLRALDLNAALSAWTDSFQGLADKKQIQLTYQTRGRGFETMGDEAKLERVFYNIMGNAFKFTPEGGAIDVSLAHAGDKYIIGIGDTGPGIPEASVARIFESYYQVGDVHVEGTGLGLALAKAFVTLHGGTITAQNKPSGTGTLFTITLPVCNTEGQTPVPTTVTAADDAMARELLDIESHELSTVSDDELAADADVLTADVEGSDASRPIALIIDDNADIRLFLRSLLGQHYRVFSAADGREGLLKAGQVVPDVIVCDVMMPVMDGLECCRQLKTSTATSHIPVLMLTACSLDEQRVQGLAEGADAYIAKPFSSSVLLAQLDSLIRNRARIKAALLPVESKAAPDEVASTVVATDAEPAVRGKDPETAPKLSKYDEEFLARLRQLIDHNLCDDTYSVERLASDICLSRTQLFRKCKALTGLSPVELLRNTRLQQARQLLAEGRGSVAEVASLVGFADASYFTRCYKAYFGTTPHEQTKQKY